MKNLALWLKLFDSINADSGIAYNDNRSLYADLGNDTILVIEAAQQDNHLIMHFENDDKTEDLVIDGHLVHEINDNRYESIRKQINQFVHAQKGK